MDMAGEARLGASRQQVWDALNDVEVLKASIPGCEVLEKTSDTEFSATVISKVGPIKARFAGKVTLSNIVAPVSYTLVGEGQGGLAGFAKADIEVALEALEENTTLLRYGVKANVGGKLAQLGARLIDATARKSADQFFEKFTVEVDRRAAEMPPHTSESHSAGLEVASVVMPQIAATGPLTPYSVPADAPVALSPPLPASVPRSISPASTASAQLSATLTDVWMSDQIKIWIADKIAVVTLNRPEARNAMNYAMWRAIPDIFAALDRNPEVRSIILTGTGADFSAGADIAEFAKVRDDAQQALAYEIAVDACCSAIANVNKPTIAVINGYCLGGGAHLAMSCDFRYAAVDAQCGIPAAKLSIIYGTKGTQKLLTLVGLTQAKKILYGGERFGALEALRIGFVDHLAGGEPLPAAAGSRWFSRAAASATKAGDVMADARAFAKSLASNAPLTIAGAKAILNSVAMGTGALDEAAAEALIAQASSSADYREGRAAFAAKRAPAFQGR